jgi:nucleoside-diphosphate-sugar epimerase
MKVLITGANGFLGSYLCKAYSEKNIVTIGLSGCNYNLDLTTTVPPFNQPFTTVIHAAGLAHIIPRTPDEQRLFFNVNVSGTINLLNALEKNTPLPEQLVYISTVAVYGIETGKDIGEETELNGNTAYALSKIEAERILQNWGAEHNVKILIFRLPLLAGQNPPGNLGAMIKAIKRGYYFRIGDGSARRSIVLAEDVAAFIASGVKASGIYNLTDGYNPSLRELETLIAEKTGKRIKVLPYSLIKVLAKAGDLMPKFPVNSLRLSKLTSTLTFSDRKAREEIGWHSGSVIEKLII